jgi:primosomal protein N' (replication factor Y) (superfamily II helicase)
MSETLYAEVAVNIPHISGLFHYHLPPELEGQVKPGCLVVVPFGNREVQGIVLRLLDRPEVRETRPLLALLDELPVVTPAQLELAHWMANETLSPLAACFTPMLPPGLGQQSDTLYRLNPTKVDEKELNQPQLRLVRLLQERGELRGRQLEAAMPRQGWKAAARALIRRGWLVSKPVLLPPSVRPKTVRTVQLACSPAEAEARLSSVGRAGSLAFERRQAILRFLIRDPLPVEAAWVYAESGGNLADLHKLEEDGLVVLGESETWRDPLDQLSVTLSRPPELTQAQHSAWGALQAAIQQAAAIHDGSGVLQPGSPAPRPFLLHGITGSGKTEIYMQAVTETLRLGRQALILVPEIALTPQTVRRFLARFPGQVGLVHSRLSAGERYDTWRRARAGALNVIVGPRSALFTPLPNPGLIVIDECHDSAYYQEDIPPTYSAVEAAIACARLTRSVLVLGSATPEVSLYYRAQQERWPILQLPVRILAHRQAVAAQMAHLGIENPPAPGEAGTAALNLPSIKVIDMRQELKAGNRTIFSRELQSALQATLEARQQAILFINRRGTATYVFCRQCGYTLKCPRCDLPLTFHTDNQQAPGGLVCHTCNYRRQMPKTCPECSSPHIRQFGTGTEKVESDIQALFPHARTLRYDYETTRQKDAHDILLQNFSEHRADILIGTQMLAKGLDLPLVTLVGAVLADVGLQMPDYHAGERTFQLLTQVAGRAGRSPLGGRAIFQTFQPEHYAIRAAAGHDYAGFLKQELAYRRKLGYPPFARLVRLEFRHSDNALVEGEARQMARKLETWILEGGHRATSLIGPVPCFFSRQNSLYRWQIILRGPDPAAILRGRSLGDWRIEVGPISLL